MNKEKTQLDLAIRKFKLDEFLLLISNKSREMYFNGKSLEDIEWRRKLGPFEQVFTQSMPIWGLIELSYRAVINCNDHRPQLATFGDLCKLNNLLVEMTNNVGKEKSDYTSARGAGTALLMGLSQTQLWWQEMVGNRNSMIYNFLRYYLLLNKMPDEFPEDKHPSQDLMEITGFNIPDFSKLLFVLYVWTVTTATGEISLLKNVDPEIVAKNPVLTLENVSRAMQFFVGGTLPH